jgi:NADPH:quinone reductase-like Zn-dependent oxidoreductase
MGARPAMNAVIYRRYGGPEVLERAEVEIPSPGPGEILIRVRAASVNALDLHFMRGRPRIARLATGLRRPRRNRPGVDVAGIVEAVGADVAGFKPGDAVFGACRGAFAEYACAPERALAIKPEDLSFEEAAAIPVAGLTALQGLRDKGAVAAGDRVIVNGAGGGIGTFAVQIAAALGAEVIAVCGAGKANLVRSLGAGETIDYRREDYTKRTDRFDVILDVAASHGFPANRAVLRPSGRVVIAGMTAGGAEPDLRWMLLHFGRLLGGMVLSRLGREKLRPFIARLDRADLHRIAGWATEGVVKPVIDVRHGLESVQRAIADFAGGHTTGKIVVSLGEHAAGL